MRAPVRVRPPLLDRRRSAAILAPSAALLVGLLLSGGCAPAPKPVDDSDRRSARAIPPAPGDEDALVVVLHFEPWTVEVAPDFPAWNVEVAIRKPDGEEGFLRASQPVVVGGPPPGAEPADADEALSRPPSIELTRREFDGPAPFEVFEIPPGVPEDLAYAAVFSSDWARSILITPPWLAKPLAGYRRLAGMEDDPVVWVRGFDGEWNPDENGSGAIAALGLKAVVAPRSDAVVCHGVFPTALTAAAGHGDRLYWAYDEVLVCTGPDGTPRSAGRAPGKVLALAATNEHLYALCRAGDTNSVQRWNADMTGGPLPVPDSQLPGASTAVGLYVPPPPPPIPGLEAPTGGPGVIALQAETLLGAVPEAVLGTIPLASTFAHGRLFATFTDDGRRTVWLGEIDTQSTVLARVHRTSADDLAPPAVGLIPRADGRFWWAHSEPTEPGFGGRLIEAVYDFDLGLRPRPPEAQK